MKFAFFNDGYGQGSYTRGDFKGDVIGALYAYREIEALVTPRFVHGDDKWAVRHAGEALPAEAVEAYNKRLSELLKEVCADDSITIEAIFDHIRALRGECFGEAVYAAYRADAERHALKPESVPVDIDRSELFGRRIKAGTCVIFALGDARYAEYIRRDIEFVKAAGCGAALLMSNDSAENASINLDGNTVCVADTTLSSLEIRSVDGEELNINRNDAILIYYGEAGLTECRGLSIPAEVVCCPESVLARAIAGQFSNDGLCRIYVPAGFDIKPYASLLRRTLASYRNLMRLAAVHGENVYNLGAEKLYERWPEEFFSVYEERAEGLPDGMRWRNVAPDDADWYRRFCINREASIADFINSHAGVKWLSGYFEEGTLAQKPIPWTFEGQAHGIMAQGALIDDVGTAGVLMADGSPISPRRLLADMQNPPALQLISNYLFFLTPRLAQLYNRLRDDRPHEQTHVIGGHLDYKLYYSAGRRIETFPLFRKAGMALLGDGRFMFFHFRLGGGALTLSGVPLKWTAADVDPAEPGDVAVFTPHLSCADAGADKLSYRRTVGENRVNIVIVQEDVICARDGDVVLPAMGVVVSLERTRGIEALKQAGFNKSGDGYYTRDAAPELSVRLEPPQGVAQSDWDGVQWAYGGGLTLIQNGENVLADDERYKRHMLYEGWTSPLSEQTQESDISALMRHPRTALGLTKSGKVFMLVYSGRSALSLGADYREMCGVAQRLIPEDIAEMFNVDGGASAVFGIAIGERFIECSWPSTSPNSIAGLVRPVNSMFSIVPAGC